MNAIVALALKDLKLLLRDRANAFFTFVFPLALAVFFGYVFSGMYGSGGEGVGQLPIAVVDLSGGPESRAFLADLQADAALEVTLAATQAEGEALVKKKKVGACVVIPEGFDEAAGALFAGKTLEVRAYVDPTRGAEGGLLTGKLNELAFRRMQGAFTDPAAMRKSLDNSRAALDQSDAIDPAQKALLFDMFDSITKAQGGLAAAPDGANAQGGFNGWKPIQVTVEKLEFTTAGRAMPTSSYAVSFPQGVVWGLLGCVMAFAVSLAGERAAGTLLRLTVAPIGKGAILAGKALACFLACLLVQCLLLLLAIGPFKVRVPDWGVMLLVVVLTSFAFTGLMMLLAGLARTEGAAQGLGRAVVLILAMIGGGTIPLFILPAGVQTFSKVSPFTWATISLEGALWRGYAWPDMILPGAVLLAFGLVGFVVGVSAMRWSSST
ncbi:MAG: hypothetical protein HBSAPP03_05470 [Phycisphaerae bacterium]|nr:MAG: hypothetical protein HBSAPP03_05470 [Phycisphaerae bacterium]